MAVGATAADSHQFSGSAEDRFVAEQVGIAILDLAIDEHHRQRLGLVAASDRGLLADELTLEIDKALEARLDRGEFGRELEPQLL